MASEIKVPVLGESVTEATVAEWFKSEGDAVAADEPLVELETDKVTLEVNASEAGQLSEIRVPAGENVEVGAILGVITPGVVDGAKDGQKSAAPAKKQESAKAAPAASQGAEKGGADTGAGEEGGQHLSPSVRRLLEENNLDARVVKATGKDGRLTKGDVLAHLEKGGATSAAPSSASAFSSPAAPAIKTDTGPREERVRMSRLRKRIAERLKEAQNTAAMLTTFNEVDMSAVMELRQTYRDSFEKKHGVRLGFMSFFVSAAVHALKEIPAVNAEIDGDEIVYKNHYDIGVAVGTEQGLMVPVLRDADQLSLAEIESTINELGRRARDGKLALDDLSGGTFTISNGGVYGSLMSTPILNPPQSGILGMHKIQKRPVAVGDVMEIRPMMYVALSYDHRIIDGREAVTFLVRLKEMIEDPQRILLAM